ncbi:MAG: NAD(P)H dehydrogenase (quinone) [Crocinitomix sp.]|jgi:NAD(P)H dehydrogenase (quinone)
MKNILIINGHPNPNSFNAALANAYAKGAREQDAIVSHIDIHALDFNPNLAYAYQQRMELENDLKEAWDKIQKAEHLIWVHPVWWGGLPAKMKGFIDRLFLPGMAFKFRNDSVRWDKLLAGKSARIIYTADQPSWFYRFINKRPSVHALKKMTLEFCGVKPVKKTMIGPVKSMTDIDRNKALKKVYLLGKGMK